jgi:hypothetical protein
MPSIARELIEVGHEWVCSQCSYEFYNPGCILDGLTLNEIIQHVKKMREQAFAKHKCSTTAPASSTYSLPGMLILEKS